MPRGRPRNKPINENEKQLVKQRGRPKKIKATVNEVEEKSKKIFYQAGPLPRGYRRPTLKEAAEVGQISYWGQYKADPAQIQKVAEKRNMGKKEKQLIFEGTQSNAKLKRLRSQLDVEKDPEERKKIKKELSEVTKRHNIIAKEQARRRKEENIEEENIEEERQHISHKKLKPSKQQEINEMEQLLKQTLEEEKQARKERNKEEVSQKRLESEQIELELDRALRELNISNKQFSKQEKQYKNLNKEQQKLNRERINREFLKPDKKYDEDQIILELDKKLKEHSIRKNAFLQKKEDKKVNKPLQSWQQFLKEYYKIHSNLSYKKAKEKASIEYQKLKKSNSKL